MNPNTIKEDEHEEFGNEFGAFVIPDGNASSVLDDGEHRVHNNYLRPCIPCVRALMLMYCWPERCARLARFDMQA